ncbi:TolC family protein [Lentilitoribacter sp. Alg239-R112]|uniref:TolC family protein n=1 Tax=Lentilitoribacter sp. Alg239-R112 TaxID=2305987 RepID=UPI0013A6CDEF|nr:TolC family protein [Lentilitoribacter sp. Alg239-R112]
MQQFLGYKKAEPQPHLKTTFRSLALAILVIGSADAQNNIPIPQPRDVEVDKTSKVASAPVPIPADRPIDGPAISGNAITLADAIFIGLRENRTIKSAYINRTAQRFDLKIKNDAFKPRYGVSGSLVRQNIGTRGSTTIDVSPSVSLKTQTGAKFEFAWVNSSTLASNLNNFSSVAELSFEQPLLRGAGQNVNLAPIKQAHLAEQANKQKLKATVAEVIGAIIFAHRDLLLSQKELALAKSSARRAEELLSINDALIKAGRMAAVEAVLAEADLENQRLRILQDEQRVAAAQLALLNLLALDLDTPIVAKESMTPKQVPLNIQKLMMVAFVMRPDYLSQLYTIEQSRLGLRVAENEKLWDLSLFARGRFGFQTQSSRPNEKVQDASIGFRFTIPFNDPAPQQKYLQSSTNLELADIRLKEIKQGIETQIRGSANEVEILWKQIGIAEKALKLAELVVDIEKSKLKAGRSSTFQVRTLEDTLRESEIQLLRAQVGYFNALTRLDLQLGTTLDTWRIDLRDGG